jgi:hypothetical protein
MNFRAWNGSITICRTENLGPATLPTKSGYCRRLFGAGSRGCASTHPRPPQHGKGSGAGVTPAECYPFWEHHCNGFSAPYRDLVASDVTEKTKLPVRAAVSELTTEQKDRLLLKITGWPRISFLSEIFVGAKFVHVVRDGRAVVNSQLATYFWNGWSGPANRGWGELFPARKEERDRYGQSFAFLLLSSGRS